MLKTVVLDIDGTLMDTNYLHVDAWQDAFEEAGARPARASVHEQIGKGADKLIGEFVSDCAAQQNAERLHGEFYAKIQHKGHPLPGAGDLIHSLARSGYEVWLATSAKPEELDHHLAELEAEGRIKGVVNSSEVRQSKPAPDIFELALKRSSSPPEETVAVGDAVWDVLSAKEAGIRTVAVLTGGAFSRAELEEAGAYAVYDDCAALLEAGFPEEPNSRESSSEVARSGRTA